MRKTKLLPVWMLILIDLLLIGATLCSFAYFHHVRTLWGSIEVLEEDDENKVVFTKKENDDTIDLPIADEGDYDFSGDFGMSLPEDTFLKIGEEIVFNDNTYISQDIRMTLTEVNTELEYNNKTYIVQYFVYDVYVRNIENFFTVAVTEREPFKELMQSGADITDAKGNLIYDGPAIAAINGDYLGNTTVAVRNGEVLRKSDSISGDICVLYYDGTMETITPEEYDWDEIAAKGPYQIWDFGPELLNDDGSAMTEFSAEKNSPSVINNRHPRSAIGYYEPGHYCFVIVDGRSDDSEGARMFQLAQIFDDLGCSVAYNLDGGDSCQAYWGDTCVRYDQERKDNGEAQRELYDIIGIGEVAK